MKIGICDDDMQALLHISECLEKFQKQREIKITYKAFKSGSQLIDTMKSGEYDVLILDVLMPGVTGMEVAKEIREFDNNVKIVFLTSSTEFAVESYTVEAYHYLLKPTTEEKLFPILDKLVAEIRRPIESLTVKTQSGILKIAFFNIEYVEVFSKTVSFHLTDGNIKNVYGSLKNFEKILLERDSFLKVHRSYIVNMQWIVDFGTKELITQQKHKIPISRPLYAMVRETYMKYLYLEKGMK